MTTLWTVQSASVIDDLSRGAVHFANPDLSRHWGSEPDEKWGFAQAYEWMAAQMQTRVKTPRPDGFSGFPVWAWRQSGQTVSGRPDMRRVRPKEPETLIEMSVDADDFVDSDFGLWHHVLNYWPILRSEGEEDEFHANAIAVQSDYYRTKPASDRLVDEAIRRSWETVFDPETSEWLGTNGQNRAIQSCLWAIRPDQVVSSTPIRAGGGLGKRVAFSRNGLAPREKHAIIQPVHKSAAPSGKTTKEPK